MEWIKSSGGIGGATLTPETEHYTMKLVFTSDSIFRAYKNDSLSVSTSFSVKTTTLSGGKSVEMIYYSPVWSSPQIISRLDIDTLIISDNGADGFVSTYNKIK